jgi:ribosomal protein S18 acetylase RimI-like enzyme
MDQASVSSPDRSLKIVRLESESAGAFAQVEGIYLEAFPPAERVDFRDLLAAVTEGSRTLFAAQEEGQVLAFAITTTLPGTGIHCLEYFAVCRGLRGQGVGSRLLRAVLRNLATSDVVSGLILEVESEETASERDREIRRSRIAFYRRNGAYLIDEVERFLAPDLSGTGTIDMRLMWLPADGAPARLSAPELKAAILGIYERCYELTPDDTRVEATLRSSGLFASPAIH